MIDRVITETFQISYTRIYACNILSGVGGKPRDKEVFRNLHYFIYYYKRQMEFLRMDDNKKDFSMIQ